MFPGLGIGVRYLLVPDRHGAHWGLAAEPETPLVGLHLGVVQEDGAVRLGLDGPSDVKVIKRYVLVNHNWIM